MKVIAIGILLLAGLQVASAQTVDAGASVVTHELMSPSCPGLLLADCRSDGARELRAEITRRLEAGEVSTAVEDDLVARFGGQIRTVPEFKGIGALAWIGPPVLGVTGFIVLVMAIGSAKRRRSARPPGSDVEGALEDPAMFERLRDELDALD